MLTSAPTMVGSRAADQPMSAARRQARRRAECYCGFYEACPLFRLMTPRQREACTSDKRMDAQRMWKNGM
jgi:plasmid replication initiation protein